MEEVAKPYIPRTSAACESCRVRKRKCDGQNPCSFCVLRNQECSFSARRKRGPKKRSFDSVDGEEDIPTTVAVVSPSHIDTEMSEKMEAHSYFDACWKHLHRVHALSSKSKIKSPNSVAHRVQAYATFAYTARLCGNKIKSQMYIDQARTLAGQIFDSPNSDSVSALLLMSYYSTLSYDLPRAQYYSTMGISLAKMIPVAKLDYKLFAFCKLTSIMSNIESTCAEKNGKFQELLVYLQDVKTNDRILPVFLLLTELSRSMIQVLDQTIFYVAPVFASNVFDVLDHVVVSEETRLRIFELMVNIVIATEASILSTHIGFVRKLIRKKLVLPMHRAILNWKSGHSAEAMDDALLCFACLQLMQDDCLYGILSHHPQLYLLGALVKLFLEQGQVYLAQQMSEQIKKICARMSPDLNNICVQMDQLLLNHSSDTSPASTSPSSLPSPSTPPHVYTFNTTNSITYINNSNANTFNTNIDFNYPTTENNTITLYASPVPPSTLTFNPSALIDTNLNIPDWNVENIGIGLDVSTIEQILDLH